MDSVINKKSILVYFIALLNIIFPIISIESFIVWILCYLSIYLTLKNKEKNGSSVKVALMFLIINGVIVMLLNYLQRHGVMVLFI